MPEKSVNSLFDNGMLWFADPRGKEGLDFSCNSSRKSWLNEASGAEDLLVVHTGVNEIDEALPAGGFTNNAIHEFFPAGWKKGSSSEAEVQPACLLPAILAAEAWRMKGGAGQIVWIGKSCWPSPFLLEKLNRHVAKNSPAASSLERQDKDLLASCLFTDPPDKKLKLWAIETALRSKGVAAVVAGCETLRFTLSRRFTLAAETGGTLGLFIRPPRDRSTASAALTRWQIRPAPSPGTFPRFELEIFKCKGRQPSVNSWVIEANDGQGISLHIPSDVVNRHAEAAQERSFRHRKSA